MKSVVAVDLGASSARVLCGHVSTDELSLTELCRVENEPVEIGGSLHWDVLRLYSAVLTGLKTAARESIDVASVGIDSWAVDFGLLDADGALLGNPVHYRDARGTRGFDQVLSEIEAAALYQTTGIQIAPINTIFQLAAIRNTAQLDAAATLLMIPDLIAYWLTGEIGAESTNASTTQLFDLHKENWAFDIIDAVKLPRRLFPPLRQPGDRIGRLTVGLPGDIPVTAVGSHDTASAVAAVPADNDRFGYVSCGTWSLVGVELDHPIVTTAAREANFTNERGIDGTIRFLRNVMGLWLLQESLHTWRERGLEFDLPDLLGRAATEKPFAAVVDANANEFLAPGDMPARIAGFCRRTGQNPPESPAQFTRCIVDSLALGHRAAIGKAAELADREIDVVHIVGGGSRNELLCQLTADACGLPVVAGPVEATAIGNVLVQARSLGMVDDLRGLVARTQQVRRYEPASSTGLDEAAARVGL
jgi:rhamnulokinase